LEIGFIQQQSDQCLEIGSVSVVDNQRFTDTLETVGQHLVVLTENNETIKQQSEALRLSIRRLMKLFDLHLPTGRRVQREREERVPERVVYGDLQLTGQPQ